MIHPFAPCPNRRCARTTDALTHKTRLAGSPPCQSIPQTSRRRGCERTRPRRSYLAAHSTPSAPSASAGAAGRWPADSFRLVGRPSRQESGGGSPIGYRSGRTGMRGRKTRPGQGRGEESPTETGARQGQGCGGELVRDRKRRERGWRNMENGVGIFNAGWRALPRRGEA